jgi:hypothetical protein
MNTQTGYRSRHLQGKTAAVTKTARPTFIPHPPVVEPVKLPRHSLAPLLAP